MGGMEKLTIALEPDGVIYDLLSATRNQLLKHMNVDWAPLGLKKFPYPHPEQRQLWDVPKATYQRVMTKNMFELYSEGPPLPGALGAMEVLAQLDRFEIVLITRPWGEPKSENWRKSVDGKRKWLAEHGLGHFRFEPVTNKTPDIVPFDALVDSDRTSLRYATQHGVTCIGIFSKATGNKGFPQESIDFSDLESAVTYLRHL